MYNAGISIGLHGQVCRQEWAPSGALVPPAHHPTARPHLINENVYWLTYPDTGFQIKLDSVWLDYSVKRVFVQPYTSGENTRSFSPLIICQGQPLRRCKSIKTHEKEWLTHPTPCSKEIIYRTHEKDGAWCKIPGEADGNVIIDCVGHKSAAIPV